MELPCNSSRMINIGKLFRAYSLVTRNIDDFSEFKNLELDNWFE
ncbi:hypothetical protein [Bathymodiolus platifrons methanotrophic gill symbiont]|nr:hypothetical protein [Bathymodiolus platifrons methanotrophic gill symbiont]